MAGKKCILICFNTADHALLLEKIFLILVSWETLAFLLTQWVLVLCWFLLNSLTFTCGIDEGLVLGLFISLFVLIPVLIPLLHGLLDLSANYSQSGSSCLNLSFEVQTCTFNGLLAIPQWMRIDTLHVTSPDQKFSSSFSHMCSHLYLSHLCFWKSIPPAARYKHLEATLDLCLLSLPVSKLSANL